MAKKVRKMAGNALSLRVAVNIMELFAKEVGAILSESYRGL